MNEIAFGIVIRDEILTMAQRVDQEISPITIAHAEDDARAASAILNHLTAISVRACNVYIESGGIGTATLTAIRAATERSGDGESVHRFIGRSLAAKSDAMESGAGFRDVGSKLMHDLHAKINAQKLTLPANDDGLLDQLAAFEEIAGTSGGKLGFADPLTVQKHLGYFPARAVAVLLATLPGGQMKSPQSPTDYDPFAVDAPTGHDPLGAL